MNKNQKIQLEVGATYQINGSPCICKRINRVSNQVWFKFTDGSTFFGRDHTGYCPFTLSIFESDLSSIKLIKGPSLWTRFVNKLKSIFV